MKKLTNNIIQVVYIESKRRLSPITYSAHEAMIIAIGRRVSIVMIPSRRSKMYKWHIILKHCILNCQIRTRARYVTYTIFFMGNDVIFVGVVNHLTV